MPAELSTSGSLVTDLGGRSVHLLVQAGNGPPVVLLGGCAVPSYAFREVLHRLPGRWAVALDRPGMVQTPWPGTLPSLAEEVATLADLLQRLGEPAVLVAHSMAGPHAEAVIREHPGTVRGLVLIDASVETDPRRPAPGGPWLAVSRAVRRATVLPPLAMLGSFVERLMVSGQSTRHGLGEAKPDLVREIYRRPDTLAAVVAEQAAYAGQLWDLQARLRSGPWPGTPSVVLTAGDGASARWVADQRRLAERVGGRQVLVEGSRHLMMVDRPDVVVDAVTALSGPSASPPTLSS